MKKLHKVLMGALVSVLGLVTFAGVAGAEPAPVDPTGGAFETGVNAPVDWLTGVGTPVLFAAIGTIIAIAFAARLLRKQKNPGSV